MTEKKKLKKGFILSGLIIFSLLLSLLISFSQPVQQLKLNVVDQLFEIRGPLTLQDTSVVIVAISQQADQAIPYKYPWPTNLHAKLIENLNKAGAKVIGFDVVFDKRDNYNPANDSIFANALRTYENVVLAASVQFSTQNRGGNSRSVSSIIVGPNQILSEANPNAPGFVRVMKDTDNSIRKYMLGMEYNGKQHFSLGLELLKMYEEIIPQQIEGTDKWLNLGTFKIPKYSDHLMAINYIGGPGSFPIYSYDTVIDDSTVILASEDSLFQINAFSDPHYGLKHTDVFQDKIVLVGATMPELHDLHLTPFALAGGMSGVEMHANAIQTIISGNYIYHISGLMNLLILAGLTILIVLTVRKFNGLNSFVIYLALGLGLIALSLFEFLQFRYVLDLISMLMTLTIGYITAQSYEYVVEQREKRRIQGLFSSYVSPAVVKEMIESGKDPKLGGDQVYMTAFFSDIQSFSTFSEQLSAEKLVKLINEYLSAMTNILTEHGGTLDKYIGDAIVAFFGAPVLQKNHAYKACIVSQLMQLELEKLRTKWKNEGDQWPEIVHHMQNRIGINTGKMVTGNMGSESRFNYTMMGDNVNLAARCESAAKQYGVYTMITVETKDEAEQSGDRCVFRYLDRIVVKGRTQPVYVYEIMGLSDHIKERNLRCKQKFEAGIEAYQQQEWDRAIDSFSESLELEEFIPGDHSFIHTNPSIVYLERCKRMKEKPPQNDWNGIYVMSSK